MTTTSRLDALLLALIFAALLFRLLLSPPIWQHGEAREGLVVQTIVQDQQWILPLRNGDLPSKPPFFHWIAALTGLIFGLHDCIIRLPSAIGAEVMAITTFLIGRAVGGRKTGWLAVGALLGMYEFWDSGTQARVDMIFAASITVSLAGFFFWYHDGRKSARATCYIAAAVAVLAKGPAGILLPVLVIGGALAAEGRLQLLWKLWSWSLAALVLLIDLGWYALAYQIGGNAFLALQIGRENIDRALGTGVFTSNDTYLTMAGWLAARTFPWSLVLLWSLIRRLRGKHEDFAGRFLHAWWISIFGVFALAAGKRAVYLLPLYPAIALLAARAIGALIPSAAEPDSGQKASSRTSVPCTSVRMARRIGVGFAIFDLALMLVNHNAWRDVKLRKSRLAFVEKTRSLVPSDKPLFATPELGITEIIVIAYRLRREIERKPVTSADHSDYFLAPIESIENISVATSSLVSSETDKIALVTRPAGQSAIRN